MPQRKLQKRKKRMDMRVCVPLSRAELEIVRLVNVGHSNREIAEYLGITVGTTKWHLYQIFVKLDVKNRTAAAAKARQLKLV
jgi:LuxR family transcriptional regulator, maltose regulon positive regulatory protein